MNILNVMKIAVYALKRNKFRAFLTMLGIIIGVASVIAMLAIGQGSKKSIQEQMSEMGTNLIFVRPGDDTPGVRLSSSQMQSLKLNDVETIKKRCNAISKISPVVNSNGQAVKGNNNWPTSIYGVSPDYLDIRKYKIASGRNFTEREIKTYAKVCVIGQTIIENLFENGSNPIGQYLRFGTIPFKIIGILEDKGENGMGQDQDDIIIAPYTAIQKRILSITYIQSIFASAKSEQLNSQAIEEITTTLRQSHKLKSTDEDDFSVRSQSEMVKTFTSISDIMTTLLGAIAGISLLVGGIGIMNIMYVSVTERTREIGLRLSIGGKEKDILMQFLLESTLLSVMGGIIGILLGFVVSNAVTTIMGWPIVISLSSIFFSFAVCSAIGIFFGWYPARKAAGLNPIDALRYE